MMNKKASSNLLILAGLATIIVVWSEHHAKINKFLAFNQSEDPSMAVSIIFATAAVIAVVTPLVVGYLFKTSKVLFIIVSLTGIASGSAVLFADTGIDSGLHWLIIATPFILLLLAGAVCHKGERFTGRAIIATLFLISTIFTHYFPLQSGPSAWGFEWIAAFFVLAAQYLISLISIIRFSIRAYNIKRANITHDQDSHNNRMQSDAAEPRR